MADAIQNAVDTLEARLKELTAERNVVRRRLLEDAARDVEIDAFISGCVAGAKALGAEISIPTNPAFSIQAAVNARTAFLTNRNAIAGLLPQLKSAYGLDDDDDDEDGAEVEETNVRPEMPKIADIILERLELAGEDGSKSADIRRYILDTYSADIHEKTVGMTLYRLQKEELVRRDGRVWFSASIEAKNPGGDTPGPDNSAT